MAFPRPESYAVAANERLGRIVSSVGVLGIAVHAALIPFFYWLGLPGLSALNVGSLAVWIAAWVRQHRGDYPTAVLLMTCEVMIHTFAAVSTLGFQSGFQYYLIGGVPFAIFNTRWQIRQMVVIAGAMGASFVLLYWSTPFESFVFDSPRLVQSLHTANALICFIAISLASYYFRDTTLIAERELEAQATTDPLTGIWNRRRMTEFLEAEATRTNRTGQRYGLVLGDIDRFKSINDTHGHDCGDVALLAVTEALANHLRSTDTLARWGGEEFIAVLPETDAAGTARVAEKLRHAVEETPIPYGDRDIRVTMTFGVSTGREGEPIDSVIARADRALYEGKESGRNRVVMARAWSAHGGNPPFRTP